MELHQRKPLRKPGHDYMSNAVYHITICAHKKALLFGEITKTEPNSNTVKLNLNGETVKCAIESISRIYPHVFLKSYVIMPNHVHFVLNVHYPDTSDKRPSLSMIINQTKRIASIQAGFPLWQKSFFDRIIETREDYEDVIRYIKENPRNWITDEFFVGV